MKTKNWRIYITIEQKLAMQIEANNKQEAYETAKKLTTNRTYAVENDNCYESYININWVKEITNEKEIDKNVIEDNKEYLKDLQN